MLDTKKTSRRRLLKTVVAGSGAFALTQKLPEKWARPVVDTIVVPAHAITTSECQLVGRLPEAGCASGCCIEITLLGNQISVVLQCEQLFTGNGTVEESGSFDLALNQEGVGVIPERLVGRVMDCSEVQGSLVNGECAEGDDSFVATADGTCNFIGP